MTASPSRMLLAAALGGTALGTPAPAHPSGAGEVPAIVAELAFRSEQGNAALMRGDLQGYRAHVVIGDDFTLMSPFGGRPQPPRRRTEEEWDAIARFFRNGSLRQDLLQSYASADMVVLVLLEHAHAEVGGLPAQDWSLRVTLVYRREGPEWRLAHRHADPLAGGVTVTEAAALARRAAP
ncbi:YybH family protein [Roseomonas sp. CCTCC AB2023176]|uniref:YybH family protein n=1 Tax=Roseomonas sp. CCTCC AB2023176 TaxID=3342640 RepID=UPI0035D563EE